MPFNIGPGELILVLIIALIVVGPGRLPEVGAAIGKSLREFRRAASDVSDATSAPPAAPPQPPAPVPPAVPTPPAVTAEPPSQSPQEAAPVAGGSPAPGTPSDRSQS